MSEGDGTKTTRPKVGLVASPGGHLTELVELEEAYNDCDTFYFCYDNETTRQLENAYLVPNKPYNPLRYLRNFFYLLRIFQIERPTVILSTGAEIALIPFLIAKVKGIPTVYVECGAQVRTPSLTGRILIHIANDFYVQWPELLEVYGPKAQYAGSLIDETPPT